MDTTKVGIIGIGRMGKIHLNNLCTKIDGIEVIAAINPSEEGQSFARAFGVPLVTSDANMAFNHPEIDALVICSPNNTHADYVIRAARTGKAVFCEKPIDLSLEKIRSTLAVVAKNDVPLMIGFNQRFDANFSEVKKDLELGKIGRPHSLHIISRDPVPPPIQYIKDSGGLFKDMTIHDFDMAVFIMGSEVVKVFAQGQNLIDEEIGKANDIDTAAVMLCFENEAYGLVENSRQSVYGYDQRLEVFGAKGMIKVENPLKNSNQHSNKEGTHLSRHLDFFMDRYEATYRLEMEAFIKALRDQSAMPVTGQDGLRSMTIAEAANRSIKENRPVRIDEM